MRQVTGIRALGLWLFLMSTEWLPEAPRHTLDHAAWGGRCRRCPRDAQPRDSLAALGAAPRCPHPVGLGGPASASFPPPGQGDPWREAAGGSGAPPLQRKERTAVCDL